MRICFQGSEGQGGEDRIRHIPHLEIHDSPSMSRVINTDYRRGLPKRGIIRYAYTWK
jgi:hypothetical protein